MPLQRRRPVALLPLPDLEGLSEDAPVFYLKATGEVFLDYDSYAARLTFLLSRTFQCEYSGKSHLDYFTALQSEKAESKVVRERFPDELKGRVLASVQFQVMGRLDKLVDLVFERYKDRYFAGEKVFVDLSGDKYYARISKVFPPPAIRDAHTAALASFPTPSSSSTPLPALDDYSSVLHKLGIDLNVDPKQAKQLDPAEDYLYTVQLMDEEHKFEGSFMEVKSKALSRDRLTFSKSILKRYMRECVQRDASVAAPWTVKPSLARAFGIATMQSGDVESKNSEIRDGKLGKRRKLGVDEPAAKKRRTDDYGAAGVRTGGDGPKKVVKYPIEDLDLDPMSIHDGRVLRRVKTEVPTLPEKPRPRRDLPVPATCFDVFIETWNMLNTFSKPLALSPFSLDDYAGALNHNSRAEGEECVLLAEIHASLTNIIGTDTSRVLGSSSVSAVSSVLNAPGSTRLDEDETAPVSEDPNDTDATPQGSPVPEQGQDGDLLEQSQDATPEALFFNRLIRRGIQYGKRWDRQAKLKSDQGRSGWERHLIGAICQRGGPWYLDNFVEIMTHLFEGDPVLEESEVSVTMEEGERSSGPSAVEDLPKSSQLTDLDQLSSADRGPFPEDQYLTLPLADKLAIIGYLITLVMGSKAIRNYLEDAERELTDLRKQRADVNKERRALLERKSAGDNPNNKAENDIEPTDMKPPTTGGRDTSSQTDSRARSGTSGPPRSSTADDEEDQLVSSDAESSVAPSDAGSVTTTSRQAQREEKLSQKRLSKLASASVPSPRSSSASKGSNARNNRPSTIDDEIEQNARLDEHVEVEFRRYLGVSRCRPLGRDRFFCRYWWFDGIGGMDIAKSREDGGRVPYGTGRVFVQGPSREDWELISDVQAEGEDGMKIMTERRKHEEVVEDETALVGVGEWAFYETADELEALQSWLNAKGTRELALKNALSRWREYILAGSEERRKDLADPDRPRYDPQVTSSGRRARVKADAALPCNYLGYRNQWKKY